MENTNTMDPLLQHIKTLCHALDDIGSSFTFVWSPDHVDIDGNEESVAAASHAADRRRVAAIVIRSEDAKVLFRPPLLMHGNRCGIVGRANISVCP